MKWGTALPPSNTSVKLVARYLAQQVVTVIRHKWNTTADSPCNLPIEPSMYVCVCVCVLIKLDMCVYVFIKLRIITGQSGPVVQVILCHSALSSKSFYATRRINLLNGGLIMLDTKTSDWTRQRGRIISTCTVFT